MPVRFSLPRPKKTLVAYASDDGEIARYRALGYRLSSQKRHDKFRLTKKTAKWEQFEQEIRLFLEFGLKLTDAFGGYGELLGEYQIDAMGGAGKTLLIIECKSKEQPGKKSLHDVIRSLKDRKRALAAAAKRRFGTRYSKLAFIIALRDIVPGETDVTYAKKNSIFLWTDSYLASLRALYLTIGDRARFYVLKELGELVPPIAGASKYFKFPALVTDAGRSMLYSLFIPARVLLDICYVLRIESGQQSAYQRFLDKSRLTKIAKFIEGGKSFKNSVVLALDKSCTFHTSSRKNVNRKSAPVSGELWIPKTYASAWIIDGQHRVYGYARTDDKFWDALLPVAALQTKTRAEEASIFIDINKNQKPVDPNLIWALLYRLNPHSQEGRISELVRQLAHAGTFKGRIYIPGGHSRRTSLKLFHANLCATIADHLVEGKKSGYPLLVSDDRAELKQVAAAKRTLEILGAYFKWISKIASEVSANRWIKDFFFTNNGFNVMVRVLVQMLKHFEGNFSSTKAQQTFGRNLSTYLKEHEHEIDAARRRTSSEGERDREAFKFIRALALGHKGFASAYLKERAEDEPEAYDIMRKVEQALRNRVSGKLSSVSDNWWKKRVPEKIRLDADGRKQRREFVPWLEQKDYEPFYFLNFAEYKIIILQNNNWEEVFSGVFRDKEWLSYTLRVLESLRNETMHDRDLTDQDMTLLRITLDQLMRAIAGGKLSTEQRSELVTLAATL